MPKKECIAPNVYRWPNGRFSVRIKAGAGRKRTEQMLKAASARDAVREALSILDNPHSVTFRELASFYMESGCWKASLREPRSPTFIAAEKRNIGWLEKFYGDYKPDAILPHTLLAYRDWRVKRVQRDGCRGLRAVDIELITLSNILNWAVFHQKIPFNRVASRRPIFCSPSLARNANQCCPRSAEELHHLAGRFFENPDSEVLGWQMLIEALTGLRTNEALALRRDASHGEPGYCAEGILHVRRSKRPHTGPHAIAGTNPRIKIESELAECLAAHRRWLDRRHPGSPWWFPGRRERVELSAHANSLRHALAEIVPGIIGKHRDITSHGMRAYFVAWRRSEGDDDAMIAAKLGLRSGGAQLVWRVYGTPDSWSWGKVRAKPEKFPPAWEKLLSDGFYQSSTNPAKQAQNSALEQTKH